MLPGHGTLKFQWAEIEPVSNWDVADPIDLLQEGRIVLKHVDCPKGGTPGWSRGENLGGRGEVRRNAHEEIRLACEACRMSSGSLDELSIRPLAVALATGVSMFLPSTGRPVEIVPSQ